MNFREFLSLNEAKSPFSISVELNVRLDYVKFDDIKQMAKTLFGDDVRISWDETMYDRKKEIHHDLYQIIPDDTGLLNKSAVEQLKKWIIKKNNRNDMESKELKVSIQNLDTTLDNIFPRTPRELVYKKLFGKTPIKYGAKIKASNETDFKTFTVQNVISNEMYLGVMNNKISRGSTILLFVKDKGVYTQDNAPIEYKKYF